MDLTIAKQVSRGRVFTLIPHFLKGTQATQKEILITQAQRLTVSAVKGFLPVHADGETICEHGDKITIELLPKQIELICQPPQESA
jgi:diacylglycerol kinase family enzyme